VLDEADRRIKADRVEEPRDIGIQRPVHRRAIDPDRESVQRIVPAAPGRVTRSRFPWAVMRGLRRENDRLTSLVVRVSKWIS